MSTYENKLLRITLYSLVGFTVIRFCEWIGGAIRHSKSIGIHAMKKSTYILLLLIIWSFFTYGQKSKDNQTTPEYLESIYEFLNYLLDDIDKFTVTKLPEDIAVAKILHNKGLNVRLNIERHQPDLNNYFSERGVIDTESISLIVTKTYVRHLKNQPLELDEEIDFQLNFAFLTEDHGDYLVLPERKPSTGEEGLLEFFPKGQHVRIRETGNISIIAEIVEYLDSGKLSAIIIDILNPENRTIEYQLNDAIEGCPIHFDLVPAVDK